MFDWVLNTLVESLISVTFGKITEQLYEIFPVFDYFSVISFSANKANQADTTNGKEKATESKKQFP